jgi:hypothetical protein
VKSDARRRDDANDDDGEGDVDGAKRRREDAKAHRWVGGAREQWEERRGVAFERSRTAKALVRGRSGENARRRGDDVE